MSDGDVLVLGIPGPCAPAYRRLCHGQGSIEDLVTDTARAIQWFINDYGKEPQLLLNQFAKFIDSKNAEKLSSSEYIDIEEHINHLAQNIGGNKRGISISKSVCLSIISSLEQGGYFIDIYREISLRYVRKIYKSTFRGAVNSVIEHLDGTPQYVIEDRLNVLEEHIPPHLEYFAQQLAEGILNNNHVKPRMLPQERPVVELGSEWD
jgi:hypothetical protein